MPNELLTRDEFRQAVFERDGHKCIACGHPAQDAHHILERRLWPDGGYYLNNGASLCGKCHIKAETTEYSVEQIRELAGVDVILPPHFYSDTTYDKWGNVILEDGRRLPGELFEDFSVQKVLAYGSALAKFNWYVKYPRTMHLPWSPGVGKDDRVMDAYTYDKDVVVTLKMDGENTTMYSDYIHARSLNYNRHDSRTWVKNLWSQIAHDIPEGWRICGENLYAKHSIHYKDLRSYFQVFSIWVGNECLGWKETEEWCKLLGLKTVGIIGFGSSSGFVDRCKEDPSFGIVPELHEGYVVRPLDSFKMKDFKTVVGKYVRKGHVTSENHWIHRPVEINGLRDDRR